VYKIPYQDPHPDWTEVVVLWEDILGGPEYSIRDILDWINSAPGEKYHLHGYQSDKGFAFRFKNPNDAIHFKLRWM
jgi:hypothetical protein